VPGNTFGRFRVQHNTGDRSRSVTRAQFIVSKRFNFSSQATSKQTNEAHSEARQRQTALIDEDRGISAEVVDETGKVATANHGGYLVITKPWPAMLMTIYKDPERYKATYWSQIKGKYFTGDGCRLDEDGFFWLMGRIDDVINLAGHRIGTMEVESALVSHPKVAEAAVVGKPDQLKGQVLVAYVVLRSGESRSEALKDELKKHVRKEIGPIAVPEAIYITDKLPKTRSGKIMRRVIRALVGGQEIGDTTTLEDPGAVEEVRKWLAAEEGKAP